MPDIDRLASGKWQARWRDDTGRQRKKSFRTKALAIGHLNDVESAKRHGMYIDVTDRTTVAEYARRWIEARPYRRSSRERRDAQLREHIEGTPLGGMRLNAVRPSDVQAWATARTLVLGPATVRSVLGLLRAIFSAAAADRLIGFSPAAGRIALPSAEPERIVPLTVAQVRKLSGVVSKRLRALVIVQGATGLRIGELLALQVSEVDFLRRTVSVNEQLHPRDRVRMPPKTPSSVRTVPLPQIAADELARHMQLFPPDDGFLFTNARALPYQHHTYNDNVVKAAKRAGLPHTTTHDLRHHYASVLLAAGESVVTVAERLGHRNATLVLRVYGHLMPDSEDRTRRAIDAAWSAPNVPPAVETGT